jgi:hypothetical protein
LPDEEDETEPFLTIASPGNNNTIINNSFGNNNINKEANSLSSSSTNNSITKNSNGKRVSCESQSATNLSGHGNYILNKIGMIKSLSEQQNKIRILG